MSKKADKNYRKKSFSRSPFGRQRNHDLDFKIENVSSKETNIYLYDEISWWGISAEGFIKDLNEITSPIINLHINSPGGAVFDGTAIYNALRQHKSKIISYIDGLAASIASVIPLATSEIIMGENAFFMIHEPFSIVIGTSEDMRAEADLLDKVSKTISKIYQNKTGKEEHEIKEFMAAETWFTAEEALEAGFIDKIYKDKEEEAKAKATMFDLSIFAHIPDVLNTSKKTTKRELENILRDAGYSASESKTIVSNVKSGDFQTEKPDNDKKADLRDEGKADNRDEAKKDGPDIQRDVEKDEVRELLIKAKTIVTAT